MKILLIPLFAACLLLIPAGGAPAEADGLRALGTALDRRGLEGVGRLDLEFDTGQGFCTAALVSPTEVLTAAHCMFEKGTGEAVPADHITFRAAFHNGREDERRRVRRRVIHPDYVYSDTPSHQSVSTDLALLELDRAVQSLTVQPFNARGHLEIGDRVQVVSYARGRADVPSSEEDCGVLDRGVRVLILDCSINFGSSGAPVFVRSSEGLQIVSVISAMGDWRGRPAAFAVTVEQGLADLRNAFDAAPRTAPVRKVLRVGEDRGGSGSIRFLRPGD